MSNFSAPLFWFLSLALTTNLTLTSKSIIWDLGNTLFTTSKFQVAREIGFSYFIKYAVLDFKNPDIQPLVLQILEQIHPSSEQPVLVAADNTGRPLPIIMDKWLAGLISDQALMQSINDYLGQLEQQKFFVSKYQKELVQRTLAAMFNPQVLARATEPITAGIALLRDCYLAQDQQGRPKNQLFVLSNWDAASFALVQKKFPEIFATYFNSDHVIISGDIGVIKPQRTAYEYVLKTYELDPKECIFIDDQYVNTLAAQTVQIPTLHLCRGNYDAIRQILTTIGAL